jgi:DNA uptake protein ComE-like DNA-binding protein
MIMKKGLLAAIIAGLLIIGFAGIVPTLTETVQAQTEATAITPINLNTATDQEILSVPGVGDRMLREFKEYRPYTTIEQFRREIGKYVDESTVAGYVQYLYVSTNPNTATESELAALPGLDDAMVQTIIENRSYADVAALSTLLSQSYDAATVATLEPYWTFE